MSRITAEPLFEHLKVPYTPKDAIISLRVQNESMFIALNNARVRQWLIRHVRIPTGKTTDIPLSLTDGNAITSVFVDPNGIHCVVATLFGDSFYVNSKTLKAIVLKKLKGHVVTSIAWNPQYNKDIETGFILIGTSTGSIFETSINNAGTVMYFKLLSDSISSSKKHDLPISNIILKVVTIDKEDRWISFICLPGQLHILKVQMNTEEALTQQSGTFFGAFVEPANAILSGMFAGAEPIRHRYVNQGPQSSSAFVISDTKTGETAARYAWVNEDGISIGSVDLSQVDSVGNFDLIKETGLIKHELSDGTTNYPLAIEMSKFHVIVLYRNKIVAFSAFNYRSYFEENLSHAHPVLISRDTTSQIVWTFNSTQIWKYKPINEGRYVWKVFLESGDFANARRLTKPMSNQSPFKSVVCGEAEHELAQKNYVRAAELFFEGDETFDNVVLRFMQDQTPKKRAGLKTYLSLRLDHETFDNEVRATLLILWIIELRLCELAELRHDPRTASTADIESLDDDAALLRAEFYSFIETNFVRDCLKANLDAAYRIVISHMDFESHVYLARLMSDFDTLIRVLIMQSRYSEALNTIVEHGRPKFFYKFAPDLLKNEPISFLKALRENSKILDPEQLLPTFYKCIHNPQMAEVAFQYFLHVVKGNFVSPAIHAFLILLYAECKPKKLLDHLKSFGGDRSQVPYDPGNALRLCLRKELKECCIFLYSLEGMHESAIKLALEISTTLAKEYANKIGDESLIALSLLSSDFNGSTSQDEMKKHVWLMIARHMLSTDANIGQVLDLIKESGYVLSVDDLLPLFPEFTSIDAIQGPLCAALKDKSEQIQSLQGRVKEAASIVDTLKRDMENRKKGYRHIKATDKCLRCHEGVLTKPFIAFNCWHYVHTVCLELFMEEFFTETEKLKYDILKQEYTKLMRQNVVEPQPILKSKINLLKQKIGQMLSSECPLCSKRVIELIDKPFFTDEEYAVEMTKWNV